MHDSLVPCYLPMHDSLVPCYPPRARLDRNLCGSSLLSIEPCRSGQVRSGKVGSCPGQECAITKLLRVSTWGVRGLLACLVSINNETCIIKRLLTQDPR